MNARFLTPFLAVFACVFLFSARSEAQGVGAAGNIFYQLDLTPVWEDSNGLGNEWGGTVPQEGGSVSTVNTRGYDLKNTFGYAFDGMWLVGFSYNIASKSSSSPAIAGGSNAADDKATLSEYGPALGILYGGWRVALTYLLSSEAKYTQKRIDENGATTADLEVTNKKGSGFLLNFGYSVAITPWLQLGPSLIYRQMTYGTRTQKDNLDPSDTQDNYTDQEFLSKSVKNTFEPYFSVTFRF